MKRHLPLILLILAILALLTSEVLAEGGYAIPRAVIAGGGGLSAGGQYDLHGTIGQPLAAVSNGGDFDMSSGFWGWLESFFDVYLPLVLRNNP
jgi:hypothetical protein